CTTKLAEVKSTTCSSPTPPTLSGSTFVPGPLSPGKVLSTVRFCWPNAAPGGAQRRTNKAMCDFTDYLHHEVLVVQLKAAQSCSLSHDDHHWIRGAHGSFGIRAKHRKNMVARRQFRRCESCWRGGDAPKLYRPVVQLKRLPGGEPAGVDGN